MEKDHSHNKRMYAGGVEPGVKVYDPYCFDDVDRDGTGGSLNSFADTNGGINGDIGGGYLADSGNGVFDNGSGGLDNGSGGFDSGSGGLDIYDNS